MTPSYLPIVLLLVATSVQPRARPVPADVAELSKKAGIQGAILASCRAEWEQGRHGAFAIAVSTREGRGRYLALHPDATAIELAAFNRQPDLSCHTPADARKLNLSLVASATIQGGIVPRWTTTVVCGFVDDTTAVCWQYSPAETGFVEVGGWTT